MQDSSPIPRETLARLIELMIQLYAETGGFLDQPDDAQRWYNRGYANGIGSALLDLGYGAALRQACSLDRSDIAEAHLSLPWGKAYAHGFAMGQRETIEVMERL